MNPVVHFEMPAEDRARVKKFYASAFGWQMQQMGPEMGNYILAMTTESDEKGPKNPGAINGGFYEKKADALSQAPHVVISVDNIDASIAAVKNASGQIVSEKMDIPGVGLYVSIKDTEGNIVGMLQPSNPPTIDAK